MRWKGIKVKSKQRQREEDNGASFRFQVFQRKTPDDDYCKYVIIGYYYIYLLTKSKVGCVHTQMNSTFNPFEVGHHKNTRNPEFHHMHVYYFYFSLFDFVTQCPHMDSSLKSWYEINVEWVIDYSCSHRQISYFQLLFPFHRSILSANSVFYLWLHKLLLLLSLHNIVTCTNEVLLLLQTSQFL